MYNKNYYQNRILLSKKIMEIYSEKGVKSKGENYVWKTYGADVLGVGYDTFTKLCNDRVHVSGDEEVPLHVEAALRSLERYRELAEKYLDGSIELWEIPHTPEYQDLIDTIRSRRQKQIDNSANARKEHPEAVEKVAVGQE